MAKNKVTRIKRSQTHIPQTLEEADIFVGLIGLSQNEIDRQEAQAEKAITRIRERLRARTEQVRKDRNALMTGIFAFAQSRRDNLIEANDGKKTIELSNGTFGWRFTPPAVSIEDDALFIAECKRWGFLTYIRTKEEVDREALLANRPKIGYLSFTHKEEFVVKPAKAREVAKTRTITVE